MKMLNAILIFPLGILQHFSQHRAQHPEFFGGYARVQPGEKRLLRGLPGPCGRLAGLCNKQTHAAFIFFIGLLFNYTLLMNIGILLFGLVALFQLITLPVEFNASRRALATIEERALLTEDEARGAKKVLSAAALTYVAALASTLAQLLRLIIISRGNRRN